MRVRLTRKLAERLDGIDVSACSVGDVIELPREAAQLLVAERWAVPVGARGEARHHSSSSIRAVAADAPARRRTVAQLRRVGEEMRAGRFDPHAQRRVDDRIRDEHHDASAITVAGDDPKA
jgi:hypothetical protein